VFTYNNNITKNFTYNNESIKAIKMSQKTFYWPLNFNLLLKL